jgi:hypothetical protein
MEPGLASHPLPQQGLQQAATTLPYTAAQISGLWIKVRVADADHALCKVTPQSMCLFARMLANRHQHHHTSLATLCGARLCTALSQSISNFKVLSDDHGACMPLCRTGKHLTAWTRPWT